MINRKKRTEILVYSDIEFLKRLTNYIEKKHEIKKLENPNTGLVMIKMRESAQKHLFYIGEVLVTECKVMLNNYIGLGILNGKQIKKSYYLAVIDAAYNAGIEETKILDNFIMEKDNELKLIKMKNVQQILKTKVDFETLDEEVKA